MDVNEVTVSQFKRFMQQKGYKPDAMVKDGWSIDKFWQLVSKYSGNAQGTPGDDRLVIEVNWNDAVAYMPNGQESDCLWKRNGNTLPEED